MNALERNTDTIAAITRIIVGYVNPDKQQINKITNDILQTLTVALKMPVIDLTSNTTYAFRLINKQIRQTFTAFHKNPKYRDHVTNTREAILKGAEKLDKKAKIVVFGPGLVEPLEQLATDGRELVLIDWDEHSLGHLQEKLLAAKKTNVSIIKMDLTGGALKLLDQLDGKTPQDLVKKIILIYKTFKPQPLPLDGAFGTCDYVISSLVATQLSGQVQSYFRTLFHDKFGCDARTYINADAKVFKEYFAAKAIFQEKLETRHFTDISSLLKPKGKAYFADTMCAISTFDESEPMLLEATINNLPEKFEVMKRRKWNWVVDPQGNTGFRIEAFLMKKKD
jgi:hypothetical protein